MVRTITLIIACTLLTAISLQAREWVSADGKFKVQAKLLDVAEGSVQLRTEDGREIVVPLTKLRQTDRGYADAYLNFKNGKPPKLADNAAVVATIRFVDQGMLERKADNVRGFAVRWPGQKRPIFVTGTYIFSHESLGIDINNLKPHMRSVEVQEAESGRVLGKANGVVQIQGSVAQYNNKPHEDLVAFWLDPATKVTALSLAEDLPEQGDPVWLLSLPVTTKDGDEAAPLKWIAGKVQTVEKQPTRAT
jgi:hypothetical protein